MTTLRSAACIAITYGPEETFTTRLDAALQLHQSVHWSLGHSSQLKVNAHGPKICAVRLAIVDQNRSLNPVESVRSDASDAPAIFPQEADLGVAEGIRPHGKAK